MKKIYMSAIAATLLSTTLMAESTSLKDAFANGKASGDISIYAENVSNNGDTKDSGFSMGSIGVNYETDTLNGFKASFGARTNHNFSEKEDGDYDGIDEDTGKVIDTPTVAINTLNLSYAMQGLTVIAGRQEIDLEWMSDYHEALVAAITAVPDTTIVLGHTERFMAVDNDAALEEMGDIGEDGANVIDVKYEGIANTVINPYYMDANDIFSAYGLKATTSVANVDLTAHYAATNEDTLDEDGSIAHFEIGTTVSDIALAAGYITTDTDVGAGSIAALGDNIDPTESLADSIYGADADTFYASISADVSMVTLGALYTTVDHADDRDSEITLTASAAITDELGLDVLYSSVSMEDSDEDSDTVSMMLTYSF